jgi:hypothetical protein
MTWTSVNGHWFSNPYRVYRSVKGFDLWLYGKKVGILGRGFPTFIAAQEFAEKHAGKRAKATLP